MVAAVVVVVAALGSEARFGVAPVKVDGHGAVAEALRLAALEEDGDAFDVHQASEVFERAADPDEEVLAIQHRGGFAVGLAAYLEDGGVETVDVAGPEPCVVWYLGSRPVISR